MKESEWLSVCAEFDAMGESAVRACMARGDWSQLHIKYGCAVEWCRRKEEERATASASKRDSREEETLAIAKEANRIASEARTAAFEQARWAKWAAVIATVAAVIAVVFSK